MCDATRGVGLSRITYAKGSITGEGHEGWGIGSGIQSTPYYGGPWTLDCLPRTRSQAVARIADRTAKNFRGHVT